MLYDTKETEVILKGFIDPIPLQFLQGCVRREVEVFVDGSMRYPVKAHDHAFPQPNLIK
jgi:hypothetical protein